MDTIKNAKILGIYIGEADTLKGQPLYEKIILLAKENHLAGATAVKGILGFGENSRLHSAKILDLSEDLPVIVEIVDEDEKIRNFLPILNQLIEEANIGATVTLRDVEIIRHSASK
ncbi:MAG TPA: DUF190 domain-containing protein [Candidatus Paceibacterota bacterium]|nr:DUF190 domain-containing protein [Candidatus Paceibacterota bacterium]